MTRSWWTHQPLTPFRLSSSSRKVRARGIVGVALVRLTTSLRPSHNQPAHKGGYEQLAPQPACSLAQPGRLRNHIPDRWADLPDRDGARDGRTSALVQGLLARNAASA